MVLKCDAVFEGGGVKGIGLVGAYSAIQKAGYEFENLAGTSAGAIIASLIAVGYSADEIEKELRKLDYTNFKDPNFLDRLGIFGKAASAFWDYGVYKGDFFKNWLDGLLHAKGAKVFGDIKTGYTKEEHQYKFQAIVTDITERRMLVIPRDLKEFGLDPDQFSISDAVRMSMSLPIFFKPCHLKDSRGKNHLLVDGGVLSNYPVWLLDDGTSDPEWPTFGFKLTDTNIKENDPFEYGKIHNIVDYGKSLVGTMLEGHDNSYVSVSKGDFERTTFISTTVRINGIDKKIKTADFGLTHEESSGLFDNGYKAGQMFLKNWDFNEWKKKYREDAAVS